MQNNSVHVKNDEELDSACAGHRSVRIMRILLKRGKEKKESWEQCTSASFSVGRNYSPRDFRLIKLEGNYVIFVTLLAGPKNKEKKKIYR